MVNKLVDIVPNKKKKDNNNFVWKTAKPKTKLDQALPLIVIGGLIIVLLTTGVIYSRGKAIAGEIVELSKSGYYSLDTAKEQIKTADWTHALETFQEAEAVFNELKEKSKYFEGSVASPKRIAEAGEYLSQAGELMTNVVLKVSNLPEKILKNNLSTTERPSSSITNDLVAIQPDLSNVNQNLKSALASFNQVNSGLLPKDVREQFKAAVSALEDITEKFTQLETDIPAILSLLGNDRVHRYLILVQNNYELRPTGGFIGNLIFVEVREGYMTLFEKHDVYDYDGQLSNPAEVPPEYIGFVNELGIRDSNYIPNFPTSAEMIDNLLQRAGGPSSDTIVAVDHTVLNDLLKHSGAITLEGYPNGEITAENFSIVLTYLIEANKLQNVNDKAILVGFVEDLKTKLLANKDIANLFRILSINVQTKHIQLYSKDSRIQSIFERYGVAGLVDKDISDDEDYLLITNSSIGGNKTDPYIRERYIHTTNINPKGEVSNELTIKKFHTFTDREELYWQRLLLPFGVEQLNDATRYVLGRGDNVSQMKVYVPFGSTITNSSGIDKTSILTFNDSETLKTYFLFPMSVKPKQTKEITIYYDTPIKLKVSPASTYKLNIQKQAGNENIMFEKHYNFSDSIQPKAYYPKNYAIDKYGTYSHEFVLKSDTKMATIIGR
jgi:hypothetical protein